MKPADGQKNLRLPVLHRLLVVYLLLGLWSLALVGRLAYLQLFHSQEYRLKAEEQQMGFVELSPKRGDILDRHLDPLAISIKIDSVFANPKEIENPLQTAKTLAGILDVHEQELYKKLLSDRVFVYLARKIPPDRSEKIRRLNIPGIYFQEETKRVYPGRQLAAHVLGFVGIDNEGLSGLEYLYNDFIKGEKSTVHLRFDAKRQSYQREGSQDQPEGNVLVLSIDRPIQYIVEQVLEKVVDSSGAKNGTAIVMDPHTGAVLAMASWPSFNPNRFTDFSAQERRNRAILDIYEPGSTFKLVTFSAVLNEGLGRPSEMIDCRVGTLRIGPKVYREATHNFDHLSLNEVLARSSNIGTIKLSLRLGEEKLYNYTKRFGFGEKTGIDLPGEQSGLLRSLAQWSMISIGAISIGQEIGVTPLQMLRAACVIANGGHLVKPHVVSRILTPEGEVLYEARNSRERILRRETVTKMTEALSLVVRDGTGTSARLEGYTSAGKTGTAQKFIDGAYSRTHFFASYAGFAPLKEPALAAIVVINEPKGLYYGSQVAAPAFKQIMERSLIHLGVPRDKPGQSEDIPGSGSSVELASRKDISMNERQFPLEQLEETVRLLIEEKPPARTPRHKLVIETETFPLPDFSGQSLREVAQVCARLGVKLKISGSGLAVGQRPAPGTQVSKETVCEVFFSNRGVNAASRVASNNED